MKNEFIDQIIEIEWNMFQETENAGGRAWCQDDRVQFNANRKAQFVLWDERTLRLYLKDLEEARDKGQNPVAWKYAYMMETTSPAEYQLIKNMLPEVPEENRTYIERMSEMTASWCEQFAESYPKLALRGRPARTASDCPGVTSAQTYCRGELSTYGTETLKSLYEMYKGYEEEGRNLFELSVEKEMQFLLGKSLEEVEALL